VLVIVFVAWFCRGPDDPSEERKRQARARQHLDELVPSTWTETCWSGDGWGMVLREASPGRWNWKFSEQEDGLHVVAVGLPLGGDVVGTPAGLARRLLRGEDIHRDLAAPFALLCVDEAAGRMAVQQDWHGMGQMFTYRKDKVTAFSNRPSVLSPVLGQEPRPNLNGWSLYLQTSMFTGDSSPFRGARLLGPGERTTGVRSHGDRWRLQREQRFNIDDVVAEAMTARPPLEDVALSVVDAAQRAVRSLTRLWPEPLSMGLSGGKDSRLLAAALVDAELVARFRTNEDNPLEGEVARRLNRTLREQVGIDIPHDFHVASETAQVLAHSVHERARQLQYRHDFMFRSTYLNRPLQASYPDVFPRPRILGVFGEYITDYWVPASWRKNPGMATPEGARRALHHKMTGLVPGRALRPDVRTRAADFVDGILDKAGEHGLDPFATLGYGYMTGRIRRACSALSHPDQTMPLAMPETVRAAMQLSPEQKSEQSVHRFVIDRLVPSWSGVPFVSIGTGRTEADKMRVWHGSGADELKALSSRRFGPVTNLFRRPAVQKAVARASAGRAIGGDDWVLRQFAVAAVADDFFRGDA
jgi:asparagine synthase (glutamine-hydrolysing)